MLDRHQTVLVEAVVVALGIKIILQFRLAHHIQLWLELAPTVAPAVKVIL